MRYISAIAVLLSVTLASAHGFADPELPTTNQEYLQPRLILDDTQTLSSVHLEMLNRLYANPLPLGDRPITCFAPGFPEKGIREFERAVWGDNSIQFQAGSRWSFTATDGGTGAYGNPATVTYSFVPDGTAVAGFNGEPSAPSDLFAQFDALYGSTQAWQDVFHQMYDRWSELTGLTMVYEPNDDGAAIGGSNPGVLGVRGDARVSGHFIDGNFGILAYNFYPNTGDMVIDSGDSFYANLANDSLRLRNTAAHEVGHGIGMPHNCPINQTKLLEPFLTTAFDGPQHDDIRAGHRKYGDPFESNDTSGAAGDLGTLAFGTTTTANVSIDAASGTDFYQFDIPGDATTTVTLTPIGLTYLDGPQNGDGSCQAGTNYDSLAANNLDLAVIDGDGSTVLSQSNGNPAGSVEEVASLALTAASGPFFVRVTSGATDEVQVYQLDIELATAIDPSSPPTDIMLSASTAIDDVAAGTLVGTLTTTDPDMGDIFTYLIVSDTSGGAFGIDGDRLEVANSGLLTFESSTSETVRIRTTDLGANSYEENFDITIVNANDPPVLGGIGNKVAYVGEELSFTATATDSETSAGSFTFTLDSAALAAGATIGATSGVFSFTPTAPQTGVQQAVTVTVTDDGSPTLDDSEAITVSIASRPPGLPYTETFDDVLNRDLALTDADWDTAQGLLILGALGGVSTTRGVSFDTDLGTAISYTINDDSDDLYRVTLTVVETKPSGTDIVYSVSNDGGATWNVIVPGEVFTFPDTDNDLRWRAELSTTTSSATPSVDTLTIVNIGPPSSAEQWMGYE